MQLKKVPLQNRLYAFALDIGLVAGIKILIVQNLASHLNSLLMYYGKHTNSDSWEKELSLFVFSLFPLLWTGYITVCTYLAGTTFGSKAMNYHFEKIQHGVTEHLSLTQCAQRAMLLLSCIYSFGFVALISVFRKDKKTLTDLVENVFPVLNEHPYEVIALPVLLPSSVNSEQSDNDKKAA